MTFVPGQELTAAELNQLIPPSGPLLGGTGTTFTIVNLGAGIDINGGGSIEAEWQVAKVVALLGMAITGLGTLKADWEGGAVNVLGSGLSLSGGTLSATGTGGSVTNVATGAGLSGGPISTSGTIVANYQGGTLTTFGTGLTLSGGTLTPNYQAGVLSSFHSGLTLTAGSLAPDWQGGPVSTIGHGVSINSGTIAVKGQATIAATAGTTIAIAPSGSITNYMINGPSAGGTVHLTGSFTPGDTIVVNVSNGATATNFILGAGFNFSAAVPSYTSTAIANERDILAIICNTGTVGDVAAINQGFNP